MAKVFGKKEFVKANISITRFAHLIGAHSKSIAKYFNGELKKQEVIDRIVIGIKVMIEHNLVWPTVQYVPNSDKHIKEYEKNKKKSEKLDKKFQTAYKKALKKAGF